MAFGFDDVASAAQEGVKEIGKSSVKEVGNESPFKMIPRTGGEWSGDVGNSIWNPNREDIPKNKNYSNLEGKTWGEIQDEYKIEGVRFKDGEPDFSEISRGTVEIDNFTDERYGLGGNFDQADCKLAESKECEREDVQTWRRENNYTWHERSDCRTMDKVPREVHGNIPHSGGISEIRNKG